MKKPNILFLMVDQMRFDALGFATPHLNSLCEDGCQFTECMTTSPICAPARASLLVGKYPHQLGIVNNAPHQIESNSPNWVNTLRKNGYETSVFGKTHYYAYDGSIPDMRKAEAYIQSLGFNVVDEVPGPRVAGRLLSHVTQLWRDQGLIDVYNEDMRRRYGENQTDVNPTVLPQSLYLDSYVGEQGYSYLSDYSGDAPFFSMISFPGPHDPWDAPLEYVKKFEHVAVEQALPDFINANTARPLGDYDKPLPYKRVSKEDAASIRRAYLAKVNLIDKQIGRILCLLKAKSLYENTIIVFVSDHGEMLGDRGRLYKQNFLDSSLKIPFILKQAGPPKRDVSNNLVELLDLGPTLLDLVGIQVPDGQEGKSVCSERRGFVFSEYNGETAVITDEWKMVVNRERKPYMLFDRRNDIAEMYNLAGMDLQIEQDLLSLIVAFLKKK
ncbi:arylsulfatase A family protein [Sphaerochaeta pleomorpha str. Grapes]|uniref:Arylsulfatase A family protein n=1 Tax=Sphaerochaeta pleomorpha (strain ATCC BAA-1885 / DSM 22778 / Grapes) TaxID=158190 RepID=G8QWS3_SPHPG|nr:sulfatase-like hydrolase/transferase [Sphaerochaeta pleomorpha]AEV28367.1 arylsulfatase A family protein [Sphaerochaeta pleomorpha str. Grapes]